MATTTQAEKNEVLTLEQQQTNEPDYVKPVPIVEKQDYSGAHEKTDPREIALVKKLDRWIMPMLWSMYWLNYLDRYNTNAPLERLGYVC